MGSWAPPRLDHEDLAFGVWSRSELDEEMKVRQPRTQAAPIVDPALLKTLTHEYVEEGRGLLELAKRHHLGREGIRAGLKRSGVKIRSPHEQLALNRQRGR